jgi:RNA polymerase sigma-70 factor, ECF subfamily
LLRCRIEPGIFQLTYRTRNVRFSRNTRLYGPSRASFAGGLQGADSHALRITTKHAQKEAEIGHLNLQWGKIPLRQGAAFAMRSSVTHEVTRLLAEWGKGDERAAAELMPLVYQELRQLAAAYLRRERQGHTLQPTALVHEAYLRLVEQSNPHWQSRSHFYGVAARVMRQVLVDHARRKKAKKRVGEPVPLEQAVSLQEDRSGALVALDAGLKDLERIDARKCKAIELRYFAGLRMDEIAQSMNVSVETVRRDLRMAEAWLHQAMQTT